MNIVPFRKALNNNYKLVDFDLRNTGYYKLNNVYLTGRNIHYPNCLLYTNEQLFSPYDEKVMSLNKESFYDNNIYEINNIKFHNIVTTPTFFFIYNVDNYYHFLYDTLPILYHYYELRKKYPKIQLLINTLYPNKKELPLFVKQSFELLNISYIFANNETVYQTMYVGSSLTHGSKSNESPSKLCYNIWNKMIPDIYYSTPKKIYISRRSQLSKHPENIGTNYTQRRKCVNEDDLVELLQKYGYNEVLCEDLSMASKIHLFEKATHIAGFIGGGMANCIFSKTNTRVLCFETPTFLEVNSRFAFSMNHTKVSYIKCCNHIKTNGKYTLYTRVKYKNNIGEIESYNNGMYTLKLSNNDVAGFSQDLNMNIIETKEEELEALDNGLNSPYICDLEKIKPYLIE
jgi:hypothetical protein